MQENRRAEKTDKKNIKKFLKKIEKSVDKDKSVMYNKNRSAQERNKKVH